MRRTQNRIISQQKLAELGELSAGVAHEIRNPLQFIYFKAVAEERRRDPQGDPVSALVTAEVDGERLERERSGPTCTDLSRVARGWATERDGSGAAEEHEGAALVLGPGRQPLRLLD